MSAIEESPEAPPRAGLSGGILTLIFVVVVAAGAWAASLTRTPAAAEIGREAPPLAFDTFDGGRFELAGHEAATNGPILLNLWASWCLPCRREFPLLSEYALANPDITVVAVAVQDQYEHARDFYTEMNPSFIVGWDGDGSVRAAYPSFGLPATFLIDSQGMVRDVVLAELTPERLATLDFG